jgi:hypothetical protein
MLDIRRGARNATNQPRPSFSVNKFTLIPELDSSKREKGAGSEKGYKETHSI